MPQSSRPRATPVDISDADLVGARRAFGESVRRVRRDQHVSQERLAHDVDLHLSMIGRVERGEVSPSLDTMLKISAGLGVELVELIKGTPSPTDRTAGPSGEPR